MYVIPDDVKAVAEAVLSHRIVPRTEARMSGASGDKVVMDLLNQTSVPMFSRAKGLTP
ncbi:hypothetical protein D3C86_2201400 [compost metagenome]